MTQRTGLSKSRGVTIIELMVVIALLGLLFGLISPALLAARNAGRSATCRQNLRQLSLAHMMYLDDHEGRFFPWREQTARGTLWYWGLEKGGGKEGNRQIIPEEGRLAPYLFSAGGVVTCPALPYEASYFKQKYALATYGYGINVYMLEGTPENRRCGIRRMDHVEEPSHTVAWADAAQVNTWQSPASPSNPMLEEWYYLNDGPPPKFHFRHNGQCNAVFADGSVRSLQPARLDTRCDGNTGIPESPDNDAFLPLVR